MDKNTMIKNLEEQAEKLKSLFNEFAAEANVIDVGVLIRLSREMRAVYRQIFEIKHCYLTSSEQNEDF